jgi:ABC-2 type transport system ATP-binding protein
MRAVTKRYGPNTVLDELDLDIGAGEVFALLGPNGAGKTTAVEILEGYRRPESGRVDVLGADPADAGAELRSRIGIVLQQTTSFERSTVRETVEMFAALFPNAMAPLDAIDLVGLVDQRDQIADTMSGGQRRRLDVACGLVGRPELLFLDEPTTGLDPEARRAMWKIVAGLREQGTTVLLTTHYLDEAEALADRIGILLAGRLCEVAEPSRVGGREDALACVRFIAPPLADDEFATWDRDGAVVRMSTDRPSEVIADLVARHGELHELTVTRPSLEDVYLDMVARMETSR